MNMNTEKDLNKILDECLDRINRGETIETCLSQNSEIAAELKPMLESAAGLHRIATISVSDDARRRARRRLLDAIEQRRKPSFWSWVSARTPAWGTAVSILLLLVVGLLGLNTATPGTIPTVVATVPEPVIINGVLQPGISNFRFLVSDAPNDIGDFSSLVVTVDHVAMLNTEGSNTLVTFTPEVKEFDLVKLPGDLTQQLWQGNVPDGQYTRVEIYVSQIVGTLKDGQTADVKLPSDKLQISIPFVVGGDKVTSFTFDITANKTGQGKYILKPQGGDSGATYQ